MWQISTTDQLFTADEYKPLIVAYRNGAAVRLSDIADVTDSLEDRRNAGLANGKPSVLIQLMKQPSANIIETVDRVYELLPQLKASIPPSINLAVIIDRTTTIRASIADIEYTILISIGLVILVVFMFLRNLWATIIPSISVPLSLLGTFGVMYLLGYSVDNLSLMALAISTGFVVDDAIVVIENITRYLEKGFSPAMAALKGSREIAFTVVSMSMSLIAVFIPILLMGGIVGRLFREFSVTLVVAIAVSLVVSLTTTPSMCAKFLHPDQHRGHGKLYRASERVFEWILGGYRVSLGWVLRHPAIHAGSHGGDGMSERVSVRHRSEGILSAAGHRAAAGQYPGVSGHGVRDCESEAQPDCGHRPSRSRRRSRWRSAEWTRRRPGESAAETDRRAQDQRRPGDRPAAAEADEDSRRAVVPAVGAGHSHRRQAEQFPVSIHGSGGHSGRSAEVGPEDSRHDQEDSRAAGFQHGSAESRTAGDAVVSIATRHRGSA